MFRIAEPVAAVDRIEPADVLLELRRCFLHFPADPRIKTIVHSGAGIQTTDLPAEQRTYGGPVFSIHREMIPSHHYYFDRFVISGLDPLSHFKEFLPTRRQMFLTDTARRPEVQSA